MMTLLGHCTRMLACSSYQDHIKSRVHLLSVHFPWRKMRQSSLWICLIPCKSRLSVRFTLYCYISTSSSTLTCSWPNSILQLQHPPLRCLHLCFQTRDTPRLDGWYAWRDCARTERVTTWLGVDARGGVPKKFAWREGREKCGYVGEVIGDGEGCWEDWIFVERLSERAVMRQKVGYW